MSLVLRFLGGAVAIIMVMTIIMLTILRLQDIKLVEVQSGSMAPVFSRKDLLLVRAEPSKIGDVVMFRNNQGVMVSHRLVSQSEDWVQTKGDANQVPDALIEKQDVDGRVIGVLPALGHVTSILRSNAGLVAFVYAPASLILALEVKRLASALRPIRYKLAGV